MIFSLTHGGILLEPGPTNVFGILNLFLAGLLLAVALRYKGQSSRDSS